MKTICKHIFLIAFSLLFSNLVLAQKQHIYGIVKDATNEEVLIGATIFCKSQKLGTYTNEQGAFDLFAELPIEIEVSYIGYETQKLNISSALSNDSMFVVKLKHNNTLETVTVVADKPLGVDKVSLQRAELIGTPSIGAKPDVLKTAQLLPGISAQNEGSALLTVRGGDPGQNQYMIDNVSLIYVNHLGGFTSVFNPDMINDMSIYKSSFPSRYGGKLSSVMNITQRKGNANKHQGSLSVGLSDLSFLAEGPLKLKGASYIITGRKTVLTDAALFLGSAISQGNSSLVSYGFHDINAKFNWEINNKNNLSLNIYEGDDYLNYFGKEEKEPFRLTNLWGNIMASAQLNSFVRPKLRASQIISYTRYRSTTKTIFNTTDDQNEAVKFLNKNKSLNSEFSLQSHWEYTPFKVYKLEFGLQENLLTSEPNLTFNSLLKNQKSSFKQSIFLHSVYLNNVISPFPRLKMNLGIRYDMPIFEKSIISTQIQPRVQLSFALNKSNSLHANYMEVYQNSHLILTPSEIMSNEVWIPADKDIPAAFSRQFSVGWHSGFYNNNYRLELGAYYKEMSGLVDFKEGYSEISGDELWKEKLAINGVGNSKGIELLFRKQAGKLQGFAAYSYSHTTRQFDDLNKGKSFIFNFDRPHSFSLSVQYAINEKLNISATWVYQTGLPYTPVTGRQRAVFSTNDTIFYEAFIYGEKNSARMRDYHRLDLGLTYKTKNKFGQNTEWTFSIYNVYNRQNPYFYYYNHSSSGELYSPSWEQEYGYKPMKLYQISFFPVIPTFSYKVYLNGERRSQRIEKKKNSGNFKERLNSWFYYED